MTDPLDPPPPVGLDALLPEAIARRAEEQGVIKARRDVLSLFALGVLAGAFIAFGAFFSIVVTAEAKGALPYGVTRLLAGLVFSLGLILVVVGGAELFTGDVLMVIAWASRRLKLRAMLRAWAVIYAGNAVGAIGTAVLIFLSGAYAFGNGTVGAAALASAGAKVNLPIFQAVILGVLCNVLVCLAVWASLGARSMTDKIMVVVPPITAFVAAGFEHSIANLFVIPLGLLLSMGQEPGLVTLTGGAAVAPALTIAGCAKEIAAVTTGNIIGGGVLVAIVYWFIYLRGSARLDAMAVAHHDIETAITKVRPDRARSHK
jgi:formate/nitrite transporter